MTIAHKDAAYRIGDADEALSLIPDAVCYGCGGVIVPVLGKIQQGVRLDWSVWIDGNYEHVERPAYPHPATVEAPVLNATDRKLVSV
jgi:hypothetical protein